MRKILTNNKKTIIGITVCVFFTLALSLLSPLNPFAQKTIGTDSWVFQYNGLSIIKGLTPYNDFFDHKGVILYLINAIGLIINKNIGIWIIEYILLFIVVFFTKKTLELFKVDSKLKYFSMIVILLFLSSSFEGGNLTEEYALPFLIVSQYIFFKFLLNKNLKNLEVVITGFSLAIVSLLRINMIGLWGIYILIILIKLLKEKEYKQLLKYIGLFLIGMLTVFIPVGIYLSLNDAFINFVKDYIIFNLKYSSVSLASKYISFKHFFNLPIVLLCFVINCLLLFTNKSDKKILIVGNLLVLIINLMSMAMSGNVYMHYSMILLPNFILPIILLMKSISKNEIKCLVIVYISIHILVPSINNFFDFQKYLYEFDNSNNINIAKYIKENTNVTDKISIFGNKNVLYVLSERYSASRYSYQFPIVNYDSNIFEEYVKDIKNNRPKLIYIAENENRFTLDFKNKLKEYGYVEKKDRFYILEGDEKK